VLITVSEYARNKDFEFVSARRNDNWLSHPMDSIMSGARFGSSLMCGEPQ